MSHFVDRHTCNCFFPVVHDLQHLFEFSRIFDLQFDNETILLFERRMEHSVEHWRPQGKHAAVYMEIFTLNFDDLVTVFPCFAEIHGDDVL